jgi:hypothetical protein
MVFTRLRTTSAIPSFDASMLVDLTHVMGLFANIGFLIVDYNVSLFSRPFSFASLMNNE